MSLLLDRAADINAVDDLYGTVLAAAAGKGEAQIVSLLLDRGADINAVGGKYGTAMAAAILGECKDIVTLLLGRGADINMVGGEYGTALATAAWTGNMDIVKLLLGQGAEVNMIGGEYGTALAAAAGGGSMNIVSLLLLLDRGADINVVGGKHGTTLTAAANGKRTDLVSLLLESGAEINMVGGKYGTALATAALDGSKELVSLLLDKGADINMTGGEYGTALAAAAYRGVTDIVQLLLEKGADIDAVGVEYGTALSTAAFGGNKDIVELLLDKGADINMEGGEYGTALTAAAFCQSTEIVSLLLDRGADINKAEGEYGTALAAAAFCQSAEIVTLLLDRGANINAVGGEYGTALAAAAFCQSADIVKLLLDRKAAIDTVGTGKYGTALAAAAFSRNKDIVNLLLERGAGINTVGGDGTYGTALAAAAFCQSSEIVQLLLDKGADINKVGGDYGTALGAAAFGRNKDIVQLLLDNGANKDIVGGKYGTALATAAFGRSKDIVELLLEKGADVNKVGGEYGTALAAAAYRWSTDIVSLLLDHGAKIDLVGGKYGTPLAAASFIWSIDIVWLLLHRKANIDIVGGKYGTATAAAAFSGSTGVMALLLEQGADVMRVGGSYATSDGVYPSALDVAKSDGSGAGPALVGLLQTAIDSLPTTQPNTPKFNDVGSRSPFPMPYTKPHAGQPEGGSPSTPPSPFDTVPLDFQKGVFIEPCQADVLCRKLDKEVLLKSLAALTGLSEDAIQAKRQWIENDICYFNTCNFDFGLAYAAARVAWQNFNDQSVDCSTIAIQRSQWHKQVLIFEEERMKAIEIDKSSSGQQVRQDLIISPYKIMPRRLWDLKSNRVVDFQMLHAFRSTVRAANPQPPFWAVSHSWTNDMSPTHTPINQYQWPIPLPKNTTLDDLRSELISLGAEYIWLDVVCLRQNSEGNLLGRLQRTEWRLDVPTIGNIYRAAAKIVRYFNGLGVPFSKEGWDDKRHWLQRAWTLQEIAQEKTTINGGIPRGKRRDQGRAPVPVLVPAQAEQDEQAQHENEQGPLLNSRGKVKGEIIKLRDAIRPVISLAAQVDTPRGCEVYELAQEMTKRHASHPVDKISGLFYLLRTTKLPCYDAHMTGEEFWKRCFHLLPVERKVEMLFGFPYRGKVPQEKDPQGKDPQEKDPQEKDPQEKDPQGKDPQGEANQWFPTWKQVLAWPTRDPALDHKRSQSSRENMKDIPEEVAVFMSNIYTIPEAKFYRTSQPSEYEVAIGSRVFDFYLPYIKQDPIDIEKGQPPFTLAAVDFGHEYNWVVCTPCGRRPRKDIVGLSGAGQVSVLKKVAVIRTDACSELDSLSLSKKADCLFI